jgi:hypothetical protein
MSDRKLASIQKILEILPIDGADNILKCSILGWQCIIAKKDNFKVGDMVVYCEIDSILPEKEEFEFLRPRKFRIRTIKLKNTISQGLVLPLSILPKKKYKEGEDVTAIIGIKKFDLQADIEARLAAEQAAREKNKIKKFLSKYSWFRRIFGSKRGGFPSFIRKTDEDRIQLFPDICEKQAGVPFQVTEKIDGQSGTYFLVRHKGLFRTKYTFGVCSRNLLLKMPNNSSYWTIAKKYNIERVLRNLIGNNEYVVLQGEIICTAIQGNKYGVSDYDFFAFNLTYPTLKVSNGLAKNVLEPEGIKFVPILSDKFYLPETIDDMLKLSTDESKLNASVLREGLVLRNYEKGISFKVVSPEFLLKYKE